MFALVNIYLDFFLNRLYKKESTVKTADSFYVI